MAVKVPKITIPEGMKEVSALELLVPDIFSQLAIDWLRLVSNRHGGREFWPSVWVELCFLEGLEESLNYLDSILEDKTDEDKKWKAEFFVELKEEYTKCIDAGFEPGKPLPVDSGEEEFDADGEPIEKKTTNFEAQSKDIQEFYLEEKTPKTKRRNKMAKTLPRSTTPKTSSVEALANSFSLSGDAVAAICTKQKVPIVKTADRSLVNTDKFIEAMNNLAEKAEKTSANRSLSAQTYWASAAGQKEKERRKEARKKKQ